MREVTEREKRFLVKAYDLSENGTKVFEQLMVGQLLGMSDVETNDMTEQMNQEYDRPIVPASGVDERGRIVEFIFTPAGREAVRNIKAGKRSLVRRSLSVLHADNATGGTIWGTLIIIGLGAIVLRLSGFSFAEMKFLKPDPIANHSSTRP